MQVGDKCWWRTPNGVMQAVRLIGHYELDMYRIQVLTTKYYVIVKGTDLRLLA